MNFRKMTLLFLSALFLLSGCNNGIGFGNSSDTMPDFQYQFKILGAKMPAQKSDMGYYNVCGGKIVFTDKATMKSIPLCAKPDCTHDGYSPDCFAVIRDMVSCFDNFQIYRSKLYRIGNNYDDDAVEEIEYLRRTSLDGTSSEVVLEFRNETISDWFIYDGHFYYQPLINSNDSGQSAFGNLYRINLESKKKELFADFSKLEGIYNSEASFRNVYNGYAYFTLYGYKNEDDYENLIGAKNFDGDIEPILKIVRFNLSDGKCEFVSPYDEYELVGFSDGQLVGRIENSVVLSDLDGANPQEIFSADNGYIYCDDSYIYVIPIDDNKVTVYNKSGKKILTATLPDEAGNSKSIMPFYDDYLWFEYYTDRGNGYLCYIEKADLLKDGSNVEFYETYEIK